MPPQSLTTPPRVQLHDLPQFRRGRAPLQTMGMAVIVVASLYFARDVFVPLALAILLSFVLTPLVSWLRKLRMGRISAAILAVLFAFGLILGFGSIVANQLSLLADNLPEYRTNVSAKIKALRGTTSGTSVLGRASGVLKDLSGEIDVAAGAPKAPPNLTTRASNTLTAVPVPVEVRAPPLTALQIIQNVLRPLLSPLATTGIVVVFVVFFLVQREDVRDRLIRLLGPSDLHRTTQALDDAGQRLSRYLLVQSTLNAGFGVVIGVGLWAIGIPNPILWGIMAMLLRFVPYVGAIIAVLAPATLALAVDPGWTLLLWTLALFIVAEVVVSQWLEPVWCGQTTGLSPLAVLVAATFWTWLWGPIGLLLSTPLTLCLVVMGRHVERLTFLEVILGDRPALTPEENFYHRVIANRPAEAAAHAEDILKEKSLSEYYDTVALRGLELAQRDVNRGFLDHDRRVQIKTVVFEIIDNLRDHSHKPAATDDTPPPAAVFPGAVLCVAGRGSLDEAAAAMLAQVLENDGVAARVAGNQAITTAHIASLDTRDVGIVFLSYLEPGGFSNARYAVRRLRRKLPNVPIIVAFWTLTEDDDRLKDAVAGTGADGIVTSISQAVAHVAGLVPKPTAV